MKGQHFIQALGLPGERQVCWYSWSSRCFVWPGSRPALEPTGGSDNRDGMLANCQRTRRRTASLTVSDLEYRVL